MKIRTVLLGCFFAFAIAFNALAAVDITSRTGTISITMANGTVVTVTADQPLPANIPDGAVITIISGTASINTTGTSTVSVSIGGSTVAVGAGTTLSAGLNAAGVVNIAVTAGQAVITNGQTSATLGANSSVNITIDPVTNAGSFQVATGSVLFLLPDGTSVTRDTTNPNVEFKAEPYTPPALPEFVNLGQEVRGDETAKDISPSK